MPNVETGAPPYGLAVFNQLDAARAREELLACCASRAFAERVAAGRPYSDTDALAAEAGRVLAELPWDDVLEALDAHPRIGERPRGPGREAAWSRRGQAGTAPADREVLEALAAGNAAYEERFGHVYLVCAAGLSAEELLRRLHARLDNDEETERRIVREELAAITRLRLAGLVAPPGGAR